MLEAITGDTIGSVYEFRNTKDYNFELFKYNSTYTDDSIMTMAVAYWLLKDKQHSYQGLEDIMVMFAEKCPCAMGGYGESFVRWLFYPKELYAYDDELGASPYESTTGRHPYESWGNGAAMRVSAVGWFFDTLEETECVASISAQSLTTIRKVSREHRRLPLLSGWPEMEKRRRRFASILKRRTDTTFIKPMSIGILSTDGTIAAKELYCKRLPAFLTPRILRMPFARPFLSAETAIRLHASQAE